MCVCLHFSGEPITGLYFSRDLVHRCEGLNRAGAVAEKGARYSFKGKVNSDNQISRILKDVEEGKDYPSLFIYFFKSQLGKHRYFSDG